MRSTWRALRPRSYVFLRLEPDPRHICTGTGLAPRPHLHWDWTHACHICTADITDKLVASATRADCASSPAVSHAPRTRLARGIPSWHSVAGAGPRHGGDSRPGHRALGRVRVPHARVARAGRRAARTGRGRGVSVGTADGAGAGATQRAARPHLAGLYICII